MHGTKARQCTLNGRREWRTTMDDRRFFRSPRFPRESTAAHCERGRIFARWAPMDWTRAPAPLFAANRDFRNRGIKNPDNCGWLPLPFRDGGIDRFLPNGLEHLEPPRYRVTCHLGTLLLLRMRCLGTIASSTKVSMEFLWRASIFLFCNSIVEIVRIFRSFIIYGGIYGIYYDIFENFLRFFGGVY